ncbi:lysine--tRNA ligase [uncultured Algimonas sp.]|uniref:lysine--tRNA ligase n=1 Tax=uncultured Algimonas sp. TaxID=1547920 RepID=UPI0026073F4B|nr:lysine--tRNA ligase [uncultured Algimonas sp.]
MIDPENIDLKDLDPAFAKSKAWPIEEARNILKRLFIEGKRGIKRDGPVTFETGYGPSGLPHIGTFGEVVRTTMVRHAFVAMTGGQIDTTILCVSDDMDGMRKIPGTVPDPVALEPYLQQPLTRVPDPFGTHDSFGDNMNARLQSFLDGFGFDYKFRSATALYKSGAFDPWLIRTLEQFDAIMAVMLPTLGEERRATYSPILPISPTTGRVLYVPMKAVDAKAGTVTFDDEDGTEVTQSVTGGNAKLQWKPDFGMRWAALGVDFEMFGKDHQDNAPIYSKICRILGGEPPVQYVYELFLDERGEKISKTKGNGISVEDWLTYAPAESLSLFQFLRPRVAKRLYFDVIPKMVDEYYQHLAAYADQDEKARLNNPVWHIHSGQPPDYVPPLSYQLLLNLVSAANASSKDILWGFITRYAPDATPDANPEMDRLCDYAVRYYQDFVAPTKAYRDPTDAERAALADLATRLRAVDPSAVKDGEALQTLTFTIGKDHDFENLRDWFTAIYEVTMGQSQGPRFGSFVAIYGPHETADMIEARLE